MNKHPDIERDEALAQAARAELEQSTEALDVITMARLRTARARAMQAIPRRRPLPVWLPAAALALLVMAVAAVLQLQPQIAEQNSLELMSTLDEDYELYENLEFYEWLEAETDEHSV